MIVLDTGLPADSLPGRWTLPSQRGMHALLGMAENEFMRRTGATFKLATEHSGWQGDGSRFLHAHGEIGSDLGGTPFYKSCSAGDRRPAARIARGLLAGGAAARLGRFAEPMGDAKALTSSFTYGFHLDEAAYVAYLRAHAVNLGVQRVAGTLVGCDPAAEWRSRKHCACESGESVKADLFLDCSGADALLLRHLGDTERDDWSAWLPCDRMLVGTSAAVAGCRRGDAHGGHRRRLVVARTAGAPIRWRATCTAAPSPATSAALRQLQSAVPGLGTAKLAPLASGRRRALLGAATALRSARRPCELEPLAGADLHFAQLGLGTLIELFPLDVASAIEGAEYNRVMARTRRRAARFHAGALSRRARPRQEISGAQLRAARLPQRLADKLDLFQASARINLLDHETFEEVDWAWLLLGARVTPAALELQIRARVEAVTAQQVAPLRTHIERPRGFHAAAHRVCSAFAHGLHMQQTH